MWGVFLPINLYQPLGQSTPKLPYGEPLVWEISRVVNYIFLLLLLSPPPQSAKWAWLRCLYAQAWRFYFGRPCSACAVIILSWPRESAHCPALKPAPHHLGRADPVLLPARACTKQTTDGMVILSNLSIVRLFHQLATCSVHQLASYLLRVLPGATSVQTHQVPCHTYIHVFASVYIFFHLRMVNNHELGLSLIKIHTSTDLTPYV